MLVLRSLYNQHIEHPSFYFENMLLVIHLDSLSENHSEPKIYMYIIVR
jgi:hypothetical protein